MFYHFLTRVNIPTKLVRHSKIADNDLKFDTIQSQNWEYFIEWILKVFESSNIVDNIDYSTVKEAKLSQRSVENLTACKKTCQYFYKQIWQYFETMIKTLPPSDLLQIDHNLQNHYYFIDFKSSFNVEEIFNTFCEFYHKQGRFPDVQRMIIIPRARLPAFTQTDEAILPNKPFKKFIATEARGLVSIQALAALSLFLFGGANINVATEATTEVLHEMFYQALNRENDKILLEFDKL